MWILNKNLKKWSTDHFENSPPGWSRFFKCKNGSKHWVKAGGDQTSYDPDHIDWQDHRCIHLCVKGLNMDHLSQASGYPLQTLDTKLGRPPRLHSFQRDIRNCRWLYVYIPIWQKIGLGTKVWCDSGNTIPSLLTWSGVIANQMQTARFTKGIFIGHYYSCAVLTSIIILTVSHEG